MSKQKLWFLILLFPIQALAQEDIPQETEDPTAPLPTITLQDEHAASIWRQGGTRNSYSLGIVNPFIAWRRPNILAVTLPYNTGTGVTSGAGAMQIGDLMIFSSDKTRYGVGLGAILSPPNANSQALKYGPALGFVHTIDKCNLGVINFNFFNDDVAISALQLVAGCALDGDWTISTGNFMPRYDWRSGKLLELPLSIQFGRVVSLLGQPLKFFINPRYNMQDTDGSSQWTVIVGLTLIANPLEKIQ